MQALQFSNINPTVAQKILAKITVQITVHLAVSENLVWALNTHSQIGLKLQLTFKTVICSDDERRERHRQNYMHISVHTSQAWADTFISELNDTHVEAELRTKHIPPQVSSAIQFLLTCMAFY